MDIQLYSKATDNKGKPISYELAINAIQKGTTKLAPKLRESILELRRLREFIEVSKSKSDYSNQNTGFVAYVEEFIQQYENLKKSLPAVTWSGTFESRKVSGLIEYTNLMCIDIDKIGIDAADKLKSQFEADNFILAAFVSPSGNGLKVLLEVNTPAKDHKRAFIQVEKYFLDKYKIVVDPSGKDVCRLCFLSFDENIYLNQHALKFTVSDDEPTDYKELEIKKLSKYTKDEQSRLLNSGQTVNDIYESTQQVIAYTDGNRNNFIFKFACNCNRVGINQSEAIQFALSFATDQQPREVEATVKSAYTHNASQFGIFAKKNIPATTPGTNAAPTTGQKPPQPKTAKFWKEIKFTKGKGDDAITITRLELSRVDFCDFLFNNGHHLLKTGSEDGWQLVHSNMGIIKPVSPQQVKHYSLNWCRENKLKEVEEMLRKGQKNYFAYNELDSLPFKEVEILRDTKEQSFFCFNNCWVTVSDTGEINTHSYSKQTKHIWESNKIKHDFRVEPVDIYANVETGQLLPYELMKCEFARFVALASYNPKNEEEADFTHEQIAQRFESFCSSIGFLLDGYKHPANRKGIFAIDHQIGAQGEQNGRTGKSIIPQACGMLKKVADIGGKSFDPKYQFKLEPITIDSQIVNFNDMQRNFDPETIFELIADNYAVNRRNQGFLQIKYVDSPKVYVSSNHIPKGEGSSYTGRMHIIEFSDYFKPEHTPYDEFGHGLFDDWDEPELQRFYNFMLWCVALYKTEGLIPYPKGNYDTRKLIAEVVPEFIDFMDDRTHVKLNERIGKTDLLNAFNEKVYYPLYSNKIKPHTFAKWVKQYCRNRGFQFNPHKRGGFDKSNSIEFYTIADKNYIPLQ